MLLVEKRFDGCTLGPTGTRSDVPPSYVKHSKKDAESADRANTGGKTRERMRRRHQRLNEVLRIAGSARHKSQYAKIVSETADKERRVSPNITRATGSTKSVLRRTSVAERIPKCL